jgi:hypothetical protein
MQVQNYHCRTEVQDGLFFKIVWTVAAVLIAITGWFIITGRDDPYHKRLLRDPYYKKWLLPSHQDDKNTKT